MSNARRYTTTVLIAIGLVLVINGVTGSGYGAHLAVFLGGGILFGGLDGRYRMRR